MRYFNEFIYWLNGESSLICCEGKHCDVNPLDEIERYYDLDLVYAVGWGRLVDHWFCPDCVKVYFPCEGERRIDLQVKRSRGGKND